MPSLRLGVGIFSSDKYVQRAESTQADLQVLRVKSARRQAAVVPVRDVPERTASWSRCNRAGTCDVTDGMSTATATFQV